MSTPVAAPQCIGKDKRSCFDNPACYWSGNSCILGAQKDAPMPASASYPGAPEAPSYPTASSTTDVGTRGVAHGKTPVLYSCMVEGVTSPVEGLTWVDSVKAKTGTAGPVVEGVARSKAGVGGDTGVTCSIHVQPKHDAKEWIHRRMASNCAPRFDLNEITTINHFQCYYEGTGVIDGKRVKRPFYHIDGRLASCDGYNEYMETSDEVMESIKLYAYHKAGGEEAQMDPNQFVCMVQSLPHK